jgi:Xaa-Pro aminopeptidase
MYRFDASTIVARQQKVALLLSSVQAVVLVAAGDPVSIPGGHDQTFPWVPHPDYYWLSGSRRAGGVIAFEPSEGWVPFVVPITDAERLWDGADEEPEGRPVAELEAWLAARSRLPVVWLGCQPEGKTSSLVEQARAQAAMDAVRRVKDEAEVSLLRLATSATRAGHLMGRAVALPGVSERMVQIELEAEMFRHGADNTGYGTIVGSAHRAAILHGSPGAEVVKNGEFVLVDAGGAIAGYTADITRTFVAGCSGDTRQEALLALVETAMDASIAAATCGTEWHDVHRRSAEVIAQGLIELGLLRGDAVELANDGVAALFFPHGVGHMLGLGVRDVGGRAEGRPAGRVCCGARPRVDLPLKAGFVMTVEPGVYFVDALLDSPENRSRFADRVCWSELARWRGIGGVRLEDNILISPQGAPENLSISIPRRLPLHV